MRKWREEEDLLSQVIVFGILAVNDSVVVWSWNRVELRSKVFRSRKSSVREWHRIRLVTTCNASSFR